jgi:hypothetical protein
VVKAKCAPYLQRGEPARRPELKNLDDYDIVRIYGAEYRGIVQYYLLAHDVWRLSRLRWVAETSMLKTLASKHDSTVSKMAACHRAKIITPHGGPHVLRSPRRTPRQAGTGRTVRRDTAQTATGRVDQRPRSRTGQPPAQGVGQPTPARQVRDVRPSGPPPGSPPRPPAHRSHPTLAGSTGVDGANGEDATQDPRGLPALS